MSYQYETVAAGVTAQALGAVGAIGDLLHGVLIIPGTAAAGIVSIRDGGNADINIFAGGGTTALPGLQPFFVPLDIKAVAPGTLNGWRITTGANVTAIAIGQFT